MPPPDWARDAVIYHVFVDRFYPGNGRPWLKPDKPTGFYGGTLQGVIDKLDYIADLGATAIWLSPIFASPSHHGYDCTDYYHVEPRFGDNETLRRLVQAGTPARRARAARLRAQSLLAAMHPFFRLGAAEAEQPLLRLVHLQTLAQRVRVFFGVKSLPQWNLEQPGHAAVHHRRGLPLADTSMAWTAIAWTTPWGHAHEFWTDFHRPCARLRRTHSASPRPWSRRR